MISKKFKCINFIFRSSEVRKTKNKRDQNLNCEDELMSKMSESSTRDISLNLEKHLQKDIVPAFEKPHENIDNSESTSIRNLKHDDDLLSQNDQPEYFDSRMRLNRVIGFAANVSLEKLNNSDTTVPPTEIAQQIFDGLTEDDKIFNCNQMLKGININDIDINHVKKVIESIKNTSVEPISLPPPPPADLMELQKASIKFISISESNDHKTHEKKISWPEPQPSSSLIPNKSTSIRDKLNSEINILHKIGVSNEPKQKVISSLKPGTLIDLENSKEIRSSLHIESLRPVIKSCEKKTVLPSTASDIIVTRDPRIKKNKSILNSESTNLLSTNGQMIPNTIPNTCNHSSSTTSSSVLHSNMNNSISKSQETLSQPESLGYNELSSFRNPTCQANLQVFHKPTEHNENPNESHFNNSRKSNLNRYKQNDYTYENNLSQIQVNSKYHNETMVRCSEATSNSDINSMRDQRFKNAQYKQYRSYKEFREAKYGKFQNSNQKSTKNKNQDYHNSIKNDDKFKHNKAVPKCKIPYSGFGAVNDSGSIMSFKIPKIKRKEESFNSLKDDNTDINLTTDVIIEKNKEIDSNIDNNTDKNMIVDGILEKNKTIETSKDQSIKPCSVTVNNTSKDWKSNTLEGNDTKINLTTLINKDDLIEKDLKTVKDQDMNPEVLTESNSMNDNENGLSIITEQSCKVKKPKKYSKEKEFEKIVKEAVESLNDQDCPRIRTRSALKKNEESLIKLNTNKDRKEDVNDEQLVKNCKNLDNKSEECCKNLGSLHICGSGFNGPIETEQNIISSTSKEPSEVNYSTESGISKENTVSSNEVHSTVDNVNEKVILNIMAHPELMSILQDKGKITKLTKLLESSDINTHEENNLNIEHNQKLELSDDDKLKILRKQIRNIRKKKNRVKSNKKLKMNLSKKLLSLEKDENALVNTVSNDDHLNTEVITIDSSDENKSENLETDHLSVNQVKKKNKRIKRKEKYAHFEIQDKNSCKDLKIVLSKFDKNIKKKEHLNSKVTSYDLQTCHQPTSNENIPTSKGKRPFLGPLSVKLARQKMEAELNNSQNESIENTQHKIETANVISKEKKSSKLFKKNKNKMLDSPSLTNLLKEPYVVLNQFDYNPASIKGSSDTTFQNELPIAGKSSITMNSVESNDTDVKSKKPRPKMTELDKLHADINENCAAVLTVSNVRHCRQNKPVDYADTNNTILSKKKKNVVLNSDKKTYKQNKGKKSTLGFKEKKRNTKKMSHTTVKTAIEMETDTSHPDNLNKVKVKKSKKYKKQILNFDKNPSVTLLDVGLTSKMVSDKDFVDKFYYPMADNLIECKFCHYNDTGLNIVRHYKEKHMDEEVLPSRLSKKCAEVLISESLKENFGEMSSEQFEEYKFTKSMSVNINFTCIFCRNIFYDFIIFYDHITSHTGEYRYKCKMCKQVYSNENELEKHILEHPDYDKIDGISFLLHPDPIQKTKMFGYLCPFCYFIQLDYNNVLKHMKLRHWDEDKQCNGYWSIIRVSLSVENENIQTSKIDYKNLVGCLPPVSLDRQIQNTKLIDKDPECSVSELIAQTKKKLQVDSASIKKELQDVQESSIHLSPIQIDQCKLMFIRL